MPEDVDKERALVFHLPAGKASGEILEIDITAGAAMFPVIETVRAWRKTGKSLAVPYSPPGFVQAESAQDAAQSLPDDGRLEWIAAAIPKLGDQGVSTLAARWPEGVPTIRQARESGTPLTSIDLDQIFQAIVATAADLALSFDLFEPPYPGYGARQLKSNDPKIVALREQIERLPADLADAVNARCTAAGVPRLSSGKARVEHLAIAQGAVARATAIHQERTEAVSHYLEALPAPFRDPFLAALGVTTNADWTEGIYSAAGYLYDGIRAGFVILDDNGAALTVPEDAFLEVVKDYGGKGAVLEAARTAAKSFGLARPASSVQVASSPVLIAATIYTRAPITEDTK
jgi:hypothetical protein